MSKLYVVVDKNLLPGAKIAQSVHAAFQFAIEHPEITKNWMQNSNYICILETNDKLDLVDLINRANLKYIKHSIFREPDLGNQITAIALEPTSKSKKICSSLKLALKNT